MMTQCPDNYFDNFKDANTDYSFLINLNNSYCIPKDFSLKLSGSSSSEMHYASISVYNKTDNTTSTNALRTLMNTYAAGLFMTVPVMDL